MAHKTLIGGTAYEISGGKTLIGGTAYSIDKGKTLVDGTAYEVGFATIISFTVKSTVTSTIETFNAEEGMTWAEFITSDYNPPHPTNPSYMKMFGDTGVGGISKTGSIRHPDMSWVYFEDEIINGYQYLDYKYVD